MHAALSTVPDPRASEARVTASMARAPSRSRCSRPPGPAMFRAIARPSPLTPNNTLKTRNVASAPQHTDTVLHKRFAQKAKALVESGVEACAYRVRFSQLLTLRGRRNMATSAKKVAKKAARVPTKKVAAKKAAAP